ncbi:MAG TPA: hypothetical protein VEJ18_22420, partial [Planctomycetota bacterium]|nr:hypothetical protein [Planctomycetota bacterium]
MSGRLDELWSRFRAGGTLAPSEENELLQGMEADASRRERFLDDLHMDGLLQAVNTVERDADAFCAAFRDRL